MDINSYSIVSLTQHWFLLDGIYYRDAWVRTDTGALTFVGIRDDLIPAEL